MPNATEVPASDRKTQKNEWFASNPATAAPPAMARLTAKRSRAKAETRCPSGTTSATRAPPAGRYISVASPARKARGRMAPYEWTWDTARTAAALENMESTIVLRRPTRSARCPPTSEARTSPTPHTATARPARAGDTPRRVRYRTRNTTAKLANRLTKEPATRSHAALGSSLTFRRRVRRSFPSPTPRRLPEPSDGGKRLFGGDRSRPPGRRPGGWFGPHPGHVHLARSRRL